VESQEGQRAPACPPTDGLICRDIAALVILPGAGKLFPVAAACVSAPNWEKGQGDSFYFLFSFYGHHLFCSPSPKNVFVFLGWNKQTSLHFFSLFLPQYVFVEGGQETK